MSSASFKAPHIVTSVVAVIVDEEEQVLLTKRSVPPFLGEWVMPGGKIDLGESIVEALEREVLEEVGLAVQVGRLIDVFEHVTPGTDNYHFIIIYYLCTPLHCDLNHNRDEVDEARWVPRNELWNYKMPAGARFILGKVFPELSECNTKE
ncbi:NUDIX domain-containing protein [Geomesophilobacter sediminis]|uniref:NUDIX domain-containing protein n=1 Tax=Geomesophilobacter sediminis TaxID=2798584 RepID=A0A8J7LY99_9BACT|nr:NUDIX domain-containing protein [Geomesophilobacter sediminis]MBJ6724651.1 NUDIX domain-containing protein [Geomesophilobacter sediminis]